MTDEDLIHDGICPVCGEEFTDGFEDVSEGQSVEGVRLCVIEKDEDGEIGECLLHLPADTSAHWFHDHMLSAEALCLVGPGRIPFVGEDRNPSFEMVVGAFGAVGDDLVDALDELGAVIRGRRVVDGTPQASLGVTF